MFGAIFTGGGELDADLRLGRTWTGAAASAQLRGEFAAVPNVEIKDKTESAGVEEMRDGDVRGVIVVPAGYGGGARGGLAGLRTADRHHRLHGSDPAGPSAHTFGWSRRSSAR